MYIYILDNNPPTYISHFIESALSSRHVPNEMRDIAKIELIKPLKFLYFSTHSLDTFLSLTSTDSTVQSQKIYDQMELKWICGWHKNIYKWAEEVREQRGLFVSLTDEINLGGTGRSVNIFILYVWRSLCVRSYDIKFHRKCYRRVLLTCLWLFIDFLHIWI